MWYYEKIVIHIGVSYFYFMYLFRNPWKLMKEINLFIFKLKSSMLLMKNNSKEILIWSRFYSSPNDLHSEISFLPFFWVLLKGFPSSIIPFPTVVWVSFSQEWLITKMQYLTLTEGNWLVLTTIDIVFQRSAYFLLNNKLACVFSIYYL